LASDSCRVAAKAIFANDVLFSSYACHSCYFDLFILVHSMFAFSALALAFQRFTRKHCLQTVGLGICSVTCNWFPYCWLIQARRLRGD